MLQGYNNWKKLNEENNSQLQSYFTFDFTANDPKKTVPRVILIGNYELDFEVITDYFKKVVPGTEYLDGTLILKNTQYENLEGNIADLEINLTDFFNSSESVKKQYRTLQSIRYPEFIISSVLPDFTSRIIDKSHSSYEILVHAKYAELDIPEFRAELASSTKDELASSTKDELNKFGDIAILTPEEFRAAVDAVILVSSLGEMFNTSQDLENLIFSAALSQIADGFSQLCETVPINKDMVEIDALKSDLEKRIEPFLIDYSKLDEAAILEMKESLLELITYLVKVLRRRGELVSRLAVDTSIKLLNHIEKYPTAYQIFYPD